MLQAGKDKAVRPSIVITELPYQTNKSDFVATTARLVEEQKLTGEQKTPSWASLTQVDHCRGHDRFHSTRIISIAVAAACPAHIPLSPESCIV